MPSVNFHTYNMDLQIYPKYKVSKDEIYPRITIGDLHGNAIKLLHHLIVQRVIDLPKNNYHYLTAIYQKHTNKLTRDDLDKFEQLLEDIYIVNNCHICLLGDEMADRGANDYYTLKLLACLQGKGLNFELLLSNHGYEFIQSYEIEDISKNPLLGPTYLANLFALSLLNLSQLMLHQKVEPSNVTKLINDYYKPILKLLTYSISFSSNMITIYSHAPIDLNVVKAVAMEFNVNYFDQTKTALAQTIERINAAFREYVEQEEVFALTFTEDEDNEANHDILQYPLWCCIWNRDFKRLKFQKEVGDYHIKYVHGHTGDRYFNASNVSNLDTNIGKNGLDIEEYKVMASDEKQLSQ